MPPNAEPLLPADEANAYTTSDRPCGPGLKIECTADFITTDAAAKPRMTSGANRMCSTTIFISAPWIFLPRNSGVRPTMRPAMNTVSTASTSMPVSPTPSPPGVTSPSRRFVSGTSPPIGVKLSWKAFTEPFDEPVVAPAHVPEAVGPKRTSLPSMLPPGWVAVTGLGHAGAVQLHVAVRLGADRDADRDRHQQEHRCRRSPNRTACS